MPSPAWIDIDPERCSFLTDHRVGDAVLLPTVLQLDLVAGAVVRPGEGFRATAVRVLDPVILSETEPTRVLVTRSPAGTGSADVGPGHALRGIDGALHLTATVGPVQPVVAEPSRPAVVDVALPGTADLVYPPLFHGPAFQVLGPFGRDGEALVARLAPEPPSGRALRTVREDGGTVPVRILEALMQLCGVWELADSGRMMRPSVIDEVYAVSGPQPVAAEGIRARVEPRPAADGEPAGRVFDGEALDPAGRALLTVRGYRPIAMPGHEHPDAALRLRERLGHPPPAG